MRANHRPRRSGLGLTESPRHVVSGQGLTYNPQASRLTSHASQRGITLLEVLISMFILLVGLMGVAVLIPAGQVELLQAAKYDHAATVGRAAFRDLKARGFLNPANWSSANASSLNIPGTPYWSPATGTINTAAALPNKPTAMIDPLGLLSAAATSPPTTFPANAGGTTLRMERITPNFGNASMANTQANQIADLVFRSSDDLVTQPNTNRNLPPTQQMMGGTNRRSSLGNYSWLATICSDPTVALPTGVAPDNKVIVSVVVFYKRKLIDPLTAETSATLTFRGSGIGGGEATVANPTKALVPGQWILVGGTLPLGNVFRWYRVVNADVIDTSSSAQAISLAGPDWNTSATATTAWMQDNIIAVFEKNMRLELP